MLDASRHCGRPHGRAALGHGTQGGRWRLPAHGFAVIGLALTVLTCAGCPIDQGAAGVKSAPMQAKSGPGESPTPPSAAGASGPGAEVGQIICFYRPNPFLSFDREGDPDPEGFAFTLYLISRETNKGVLAGGTLNVKLFRLERRKGGPAERTLAREWTAETDTLVQSKVPHRFFGMGYQPQFAWEKSDNLPGWDVEIVAAFTPRGGRTVQGQTKALRVPGERAP